MFARLRGAGRHTEHDEEIKGGIVGRKGEQLSGTQKALTELGLTEQFVTSAAKRLSYKQVMALYEQVRASEIRFSPRRDPGR
jgi:hypothetical protein